MYMGEQINVTQSKGDEAIKDAVKKAAKPLFAAAVAEYDKELKQNF